MADVDAANTLYIATPYRWSEELFTGWLHRLGHPLSQMLAAGRGCPTVSSAASFRRPVHLDDDVECRLVLEDAGRSSFGTRTDVVTASGEVAVDVHVRHVWTVMHPGGSWTAEPLPGWLRDALVA